MTYFMQINEKDQRCSDLTGCDTANGYMFHKRNDGRCLCKKQTSNFATGIEQMTFAVSIFYKALLPQIDIQSDDWFASYPPLKLLKTSGADAAGKKIYEPMKSADGDNIEFEAGQSPSFPIAKWLEAAGVELDDPNDSLTGCKSTYFNNGAKGSGQHYRNSGLTLELQLNFHGTLVPNWRNAGNKVYRHKESGLTNTATKGACVTPYQKKLGKKNCIDLTKYNLNPADKGQAPVSVDVSVNAVPGWTSKGTTVTYEEPDYDGTGKTNTLSRYMRGIRFRAAATGQVSVFDHWHLLNSMAVLAITIKICPVLTGFIAFYLMPESKVYKFSQSSPLNIDREYSKFSAQTVLMMFVFKAMEKSSSKTGKMDAEALAELLESYLTKNDAENLAQSVVRMGDQNNVPMTDAEIEAGRGPAYVEDEEHKNYLTFAEFLDTITDDTVSLLLCHPCAAMFTYSATLLDPSFVSLSNPSPHR
jgi:hypothetical protein